MSSLEVDSEKGDQRPNLSQGTTVADDTSSDQRRHSEVNTVHNEEDVIEELSPGQLLDWDSPEDPDYPRNWPFRKKVFNTLIPSLMALLVFVLLDFVK
jgi:hypothetical protein